MKTLRKLLIGVTRSAIWPAYLGLAAYAVRQGPWPKTLAQPAAAVLAASALAACWPRTWSRRLFGPGGWAEDVLEMPADVGRQVRRALVALVVGARRVPVAGLAPDSGHDRPGGRPVSAPAVARVLVLGFEIGRAGGRLLGLAEAVGAGRMADGTTPDAAGRVVDGTRGGSRSAAVAGVAAVIALDAFGYSFSAHRLSTGRRGLAGGRGRLLGVLPGPAPVHRRPRLAVDQGRPGVVEARRARRRRDARRPRRPAPAAQRLPLLRRVGLLLAAWVWDVDLALFRFLSEQELWAAGHGRRQGRVRHRRRDDQGGRRSSPSAGRPGGT